MHSIKPPRCEGDGQLGIRVPGLTVRSATTRDGTHLALVGELDCATSPAFEQVVGQALAIGPPNLELDLAELEFLGVAGIRVFDQASQYCMRVGGRLVLTHPTSTARRVLTLIGLGALLTVP